MGKLHHLTSTLILSTALAAPALAQEAEVLHYMTAPSEAEAFAVFRDAFEARGGTWIDNAVAGHDNVRAALMSRFAGGNPPAGVIWELGPDLQAFADQGLIADISAAEPDWQTVLPASLQGNIAYDGGLYATPIAIEGRNWMWSSSKILDELGIEPADNWDDFLVDLQTVKDAGYIPLALGGQGWQEWGLFASVFIGYAGPEFYKSILEDHDVEAAGGPTMIGVFDTFRKLNDFVDPGSPGRAWDDTTNLVILDQAAFFIHGDWAKGLFLLAGKEPGVDFQCTLAPGTQNAYDVIVSVLVFPSGPDEEARNLLASTFLDPDTQVAYNTIKGTVPARIDANDPNADACTQLALETLANPATYVPDTLNLPGNDVQGQIEDLVTEFFNDPGYPSEEAAARFADLIALID